MAAKYSCLRSDVAGRLLVLTGGGLRSHAASGLKLLLSIGYDFFSPLQSRRDYHGAALGQRDLHRTHLYCIVGVHDVAKRTVGSTQNGTRRSRYRVLAGFQQQVNIDELVWPEAVFGIVEDPLQLGCSRRQVDLVIDSQQLSGTQFGLIVAAVGIYLQRSLAHVACDLL